MAFPPSNRNLEIARVSPRSRTMVSFDKDAEWPTPATLESGSSSQLEKMGDSKIEDVGMPVRQVDEAEEQRLIRKLDRRIVPMMVCPVFTALHGHSVLNDLAAVPFKSSSFTNLQFRCGHIS